MTKSKAERLVKELERGAKAGMDECTMTFDGVQYVVHFGGTRYIYGVRKELTGAYQPMSRAEFVDDLSAPVSA
jgi:hypothetical protein